MEKEKRDWTINHPKIYKEWDKKKNTLIPENLSKNSKIKVWWKCPKGHSYDTTIGHRTRKDYPAGCPYCSGRRVSAETSIAVTHPNLLKEWCYERNTITPYEIRYGSTKLVWWTCDKGHEYQAPPNRKTSLNSGCPYCRNLKVHEGNSLLHNFPDIAKEWNIKRNKMTVEDAIFGSAKSVWWKCEKGHEWKTTITSRTYMKSGCPICKKSFRYSDLELRTYCELKSLYGNVIWGYRLENYEVDILLKDYNIAIELDGYFWHKDKYDKDLLKNKICKENSIKLLRLREKPLKQLTNQDILFNHKNNKLETIKILVKRLTKLTGIGKEYLSRKKFLNEELYNSLKYQTSTPKRSLQKYYPEIAKQWHPIKNGKLTPNQVPCASPKRFWWICKKGHEWETSLSSMTNQTRIERGSNGCPYCRNLKVNNENSLATLNPLVSKLWDYNKNELTPNQVTLYSQKKVWWICRINKNHSFQRPIYKQVSAVNKCPICYKEKRKKE